MSLWSFAKESNERVGCQSKNDKMKREDTGKEEEMWWWKWWERKEEYIEQKKEEINIRMKNKKMWAMNFVYISI